LAQKRWKVKLYNTPIDPNSTVPLRDQIKDVLEAEIRAGRWQVGDRLPTAREISKMTGISATTVTHALTVLYQEGYLERHVGRGSFLKTTKSKPKRRTGAIGIVLGGSWTPGYAISSRLPFFHDLIQLADSEFGNWDYTTRIFHEHSLKVLGSDDEDEILTPSEFHNVDGILNLGIPPQPLLREVETHRLPMICLATTETPRGFPYVTVDDRHEIWEAVDHLYQAGHRQIGLIHTFPSLKIRRIRSRYDSFIAACEQLDIPPKPHWVLDVGPENDVQLVPIKEFFMSGDMPTAVICTQETVAKALYDVASILGRKIPEELSVICMTPRAEFGKDYRPQLSTMVTNTEAMATVGVNLLVDMIKTDSPAPVSGILIRSIWTPRQSIRNLNAGSSGVMTETETKEVVSV